MKSRTRSEETVFHVSVGSVESQWSYIPFVIHESAVQHSDKQCLYMTHSIIVFRGSHKDILSLTPHAAARSDSCVGWLTRLCKMTEYFVSKLRTEHTLASL